MGNIVPGSDNIGDLQPLDVSATVTGPGENNLSDRGLVVPRDLTLNPVLGHQGDGKAAASLAGLLVEVEPGRINDGIWWERSGQVETY